jgi:RNA polymerase sigma factor (TIGR02999 family)
MTSGPITAFEELKPEHAAMPTTPPQHADDEITGLLTDWSRGDRGALDRLVPIIHAELRRLATRFLSRERSEHTLQATALVNEAYIKLVGQRSARWENRSHFFAVAAQVMRRILVDHARARHAARRGAGAYKVSIDDVAVLSPVPDESLIDLDEALTKLAQFDPDQSRLVELRFFAGLTVEETAEVVGVSPRTVKREWRLARAWLARELGEAEAP